MAPLIQRRDAGPAWDRFAHWPRGAAVAALAAFALLLIAAAWSWPAAAPVQSPAAQPAAAAVTPQRDTDLRLYDRIVERVAAGDGYYTAALAEQRARDFPVRPGLAVRLPTLALFQAAVGRASLPIAVALMAAVLSGWWRRLGAEPGGGRHRVVAVLLILIGSAMGVKPHYVALHEVWAGLLLALSFALHRPGRWAGAWIAAALALAVRELALPFVLLMGALALLRRDWREGAAWGLLVLAFAGAMALHLHEVQRHLLPTDRPSPSWLALRGLPGWTGDIVLSSSLHLLPGRLAAPLALLPLIGWAGWRSPAGLFGLLLHAGYGLFFMIAGRENNFYWGLLLVPTWFAGLAFAPRALASLWESARHG